MNKNIEQAVADFRSFLESREEYMRAVRGPGAIVTYDKLASFVETGWERRVTTPQGAPKPDFKWHSGSDIALKDSVAVRDDRQHGE